MYAQAVADGYQRGPIYATAYNDGGRPVADYTIQRQWARAYAEGDISAEEYGQLINQTYQSFGTATGKKALPTTRRHPSRPSVRTRERRPRRNRPANQSPGGWGNRLIAIDRRISIPMVADKGVPVL